MAGVEFEYGQSIGHMAGFPLWKNEWKAAGLLFWRRVGIYVDIPMIDKYGGIKRIEEREIVFTYGANPCVAFVVIKGSNLWLGHSNGIDFTPAQQVIIKEGETGIFGGGDLTHYLWRDLLSRYDFIPQPQDRLLPQFNIAVVNRRDGDIPFGIHFGYFRKD